MSNGFRISTTNREWQPAVPFQKWWSKKWISHDATNMKLRKISICICIYTLGVQRPLRNRYCRFSPKTWNRKAYVCIHGMEAWRALHAFFRWIAFRSSGVGYAPDTKCLWRLSDWHIVEDIWTVWVWKKFQMAQAKLVTVSERRCNQEWSLRQLKRCRASIPHIALWGCWKHLEITLRKELIDKELCNWWFNADSLHSTVW